MPERPRARDQKQREIPARRAAARRSSASAWSLSTDAPPEPAEDRAGASGNGRLVVVSNRVPLPAKAGASSAGGLAVALEGALKQQGGVWFGWSGKTVEREPGPPQVIETGPITFCVLDLNKRDFDHYYTGFANRSLWPICHYRLDLLQIDTKDTAGYFRVNRTFAEALAPLLEPDDVVWVHDYHFIPLGQELRRLGCRNRIGFFLHIPWPPPDVASALPAYHRLLENFCAYDLVGFHTPQDASNFARCLAGEGIGRSLGHGLHEAHGRRIEIGSFPVGIDNEAFAAIAAKAERSRVVKRMGDSMDGRSLIIGVDRLDYSKGIENRIDAFSCLLRTNPGLRNRVTFLQVTPKSRSEVPEYKTMQREIARKVGWANGQLGEVDWTPIRYVNKAIPHTALAGLYRFAHVGLVTPLRDGMNLVAKEFVAAQDPSKPGVLVLSRFAGAAHELDGALLVNPYDTEGTAATIRAALDMPIEERRERWHSMMARLNANGVDTWCRTFLAALAGSEGGPSLADGSGLGQMAAAR